MTNPTEKCIRIFDGFDKESYLLISSEAHDFVFDGGIMCVKIILIGLARLQLPYLPPQGTSHRFAVYR